MDSLFNSLINVSIWSVAKFLMVFAFIIYGIFAFVVLRQIYMMTETLSGSPLVETVLRVLGWIFFFFSVFIVLLALLVL